jgi:hypothetical protein
MENLKYMFKSKEKEDTNITSIVDEEQIQFKPHQPRFLTSLCHVTTSSACDVLIVIQTPTNQDLHLKALVDSGATNFFLFRHLRKRQTPRHTSSYKSPPH